MLLNIFLSHIISDFAFTNVYTEPFDSTKKYYKHLLWILAIFFLFNFEMMRTIPGLIVLFSSIFAHVYFDFYRIKNKSNVKFEVLVFLPFIFLSLISYFIMNDSYMSLTFQFYLLGILMTTSIGSYLFRTINILEKTKKDTTGGTERLVIFIFLMAGQYIWVLISALIGILYKYIIEKNKTKEIFFSPIYGIIISIIWLFLINIIAN